MEAPMKRAYFIGLDTHGSFCEMAARRMHPRRTVDLDIPRQVAPLQSLTPLLQAKQA
jgi:hypothetical protein